MQREQTQDGPYWNTFHASPAALNRYLHKHQNDKSKALRLIVERIYGHMIYQDPELNTRTPEWVHSYKVYVPPAAAPLVIANPPTPPQIDSADGMASMDIESDTETLATARNQSSRRRGTLRRVWRGLKGSWRWTWGKVKAGGVAYWDAFCHPPGENVAASCRPS
jgi:hypothetical protein